MDGNIVWVGGAVAELLFTSERCRFTGLPRGGNYAQENGQSSTEGHTIKLRFQSLGKEEKNR